MQLFAAMQHLVAHPRAIQVAGYVSVSCDVNAVMHCPLPAQSGRHTQLNER